MNVAVDGVLVVVARLNVVLFVEAMIKRVAGLVFVVVFTLVVELGVVRIISTVNGAVDGVLVVVDRFIVVLCFCARVILGVALVFALVLTTAADPGIFRFTITMNAVLPVRSV